MSPFLDAGRSFNIRMPGFWPPRVSSEVAKAASAVVGLCSNWVSEYEPIVHEGGFSKCVVVPVLKW